MAVVGEVSRIQLPNGNEYEILDKDAALAKTPTNISATEETFVYQKSSGGSCKYLTSIKGKTLAWNQLIEQTNLTGNETKTGVTISYNVDGSFSLSGTASATTEFGILRQRLNLVAGHKYLIKGCPSGGSSTTYYMNLFYNNAASLLASETGNGVVVTWDASYVNLSMYITFRTGVSAPSAKWYPQVIDLTLLGLGDLTAAQFEALYPKLYYAFNAGVLKSNDAAALLTDGFNQWDEEWELGGIDENGVPITSTTNIRSKNYIPAFGNVAYKITCKSVSTANIVVYFYDANKVCIPYTGPNAYANGYNGESGLFTTPVGTAFMLFRCTSTYGPTYNNNICINLSDPSFNGTYEPYWQRVLALRLSELTGIPEGGTEADRVTMFPNGLGGAGSAFDSIFVENGVTKARKTMKRANLELLSFEYLSAAEELRWRCANTPSDMKDYGDAGVPNAVFSNVAAVSIQDQNADTTRICGAFYHTTLYIRNGSSSSAPSGYLEYELATPVVYTDLQYADGTPFTMPATILVDNGGTERIEAPEGATTPSAPFCCDSFYATISAESIIDSLDIVKKRMVLGPAESTDGHVVVFNGEGGKSVKDSGLTIATSVPSGAVFTDTHRPIKVNSTQLLGNNATPVNFTAAGSAVLVGEGDTITIASPPNRAAASGGTDTSVVTTGDKYTWNNKGTYSKPSGGIPKTDLASAVQTSLGKADTALQTHQSAFAAVSVYDTYINASQPGDSITILPGNNVTITPDAANKRITISATDTNTHRPVQVNGTEILGNTTEPLNIAGGNGITVSGDASGVMVSADVYQSKSAASGGTALSLVTTGEKYTWNNKMSSGDIIRSTKVTYLTISTFAATISSSEQATVIIGNQPATGQARSITLPGQPGDGRCFRFYHIQGNPTFYAEQVTTAYGTGRATFKLFRSDVQAVSDQESFSVNDNGLVVEFVFCGSMGNFGTWLVHHSMIY